MLAQFHAIEEVEATEVPIPIQAKMSNMSKKVAEAETKYAAAVKAVEAEKDEKKKLLKSLEGVKEECEAKVRSFEDQILQLRKGEGLDLQTVINAPGFQVLMECMQELAVEEVLETLKKVHPEYDLSCFEEMQTSS